MNEFEKARRVFRRNKAKQAWWIVVSLIAAITFVGLVSDAAASGVPLPAVPDTPKSSGPVY